MLDFHMYAWTFVAAGVLQSFWKSTQNENILEPLFFKTAFFWPLKVKIKKKMK